MYRDDANPRRGQCRCFSIHKFRLSRPAVVRLIIYVAVGAIYVAPTGNLQKVSMERDDFWFERRRV